MVRVLVLFSGPCGYGKWFFVRGLGGVWSFWAGAPHSNVPCSIWQAEVRQHRGRQLKSSKRLNVLERTEIWEAQNLD
jgi:hypothetical protein